jgi:hypothetical protein
MNVLLHHNYAKTSVTAKASSDRVAVLHNCEEFEHYQYAGFLALSDAIERLKTGEGKLAAFFGSTGWRETCMCQWSFTGHKEYAVAYILDNQAYLVVESGEPVVWPQAHFANVIYPKYDPADIPSKVDNVVQLIQPRDLQKKPA